MSRDDRFIDAFTVFNDPVDPCFVVYDLVATGHIPPTAKPPVMSPANEPPNIDGEKSATAPTSGYGHFGTTRGGSRH
jgi:hypothetical protein